MATAEVDLARVASFASWQQDQVKQFLSGPTPELVKQLLVTISKKSKEFEESASSRLKLRVELENANRTHEAKLKVVRSSLDKANEETGKLREQLKTAETLKQSAITELELVKSSSTTSETEGSLLRTRITTLESSQRDSAALLEKKSAAYDDLATELSAKHQKTVELRKEISTLEQNLSSVTSKSSSWKIREQELQQEIEALKTHNEWLDQELKTRNIDHSKFRKEKNARLSELQQQYEDAASSIESLQRSEQTLRSRLQEVTRKSEEYLQQIQNLRDDHGRDVDTYKTELDAANRLSQLLEESYKREQNRVAELSSELEERQQAAADEIGQISSEIEAETEARAEAERRVAELEVEVERLTADLEQAKQSEPVLITPKAKVNGSAIGTPRNGSPMPGSRGGINYTQLVSDYHIVKNELDAEKRRTEQLSSAIEEIMRDIELRQPEVESLQTEHTRLEGDIVQLTTLLDAASQDRDNARKSSKKLEREVSSLTREGDLLRQQLRDLSSQIKVLLMEIHNKNSGMNDLTMEQRAAFEALAQGDLDGEGAAPVTDTHRLISEHLTTFKAIEELQENNAKLLRLTRELGEQMEGEEAQQEKAQAAQNQEDLTDLRTKYEKAKDEIRILTTQSNSFIKERDMFRRMLSHRGKLPPGDQTINFGESLNGSIMPSTPARRDSVTAFGSPTSRELTDLTKAIKELQSQYDSYRKDAAQHQTILKQQSDSLAQQNSELRNEVSKKTNEATLAGDRYEMLQGNFAMVKNENQELQKRSQSLSDRVSKQEIRTQQIAEDLVEAKGLAESLRNETANLKAEKDFWKTVEKRLNDEIGSLSGDRNRLNVLNSNLQTLLNEREHSETDSRRRLQSHIETLEADLQTARQKLNDEVEENKRQTFRRDYETQQTTSRIEELMKTLSTVREELVAAQTSRDHLSSRVEELTIELRSAQDTVEIYRPKPVEVTEKSTDSGINKEQELTLEVSELKRELDLTKKELTDTKALIEQFKSISQHAEEELQAMNDTYDQYKQDTDSQLEERTEKIKQLEETIENLRTEIRDINTELLAANERGTEHSQQMETQKSTYESELAQLRNSIERSQAAVQFHQEDLRKQAEIAQQAQQSYDNELLKHAEAARNLQVIRAELSQIKLEVVESRTAADAAETKLQQNEESWSEAKQRYERELTEIRSRKDDVAAQNKLLHTQLESLNKSIGELRQKRSSDIGVGQSPAADVTANTENLNELVKYLQKEKTIVDTQYLRAQQESKRLQQQLEHTQTQLDDVRLKLAQEQRSNENVERQVLNHNKLMETLQELNLYRESNTTLRLEKQQVEVNLANRVKTAEDLQSQILPLQSKIAELEEAKEMLETDVRLATEAKDRFEKRYLDILNRSNAVDPAEFEANKQKLTELEAERAQLIENRDQLQQQVDAHPAKIQEELDQIKAQNEERMGKFREQAKEKNRQQVSTIREKETSLQTTMKEKEELLIQLQNAKAELEAAVSSKNEAESALAEQASKIAAAPEPNATEPPTTSPASSSAEIEALKAQLVAAQSNEQAEIQKSAELTEKLQTTEQRIAELEAEVSSLNVSLNAANSQITEMSARVAEASSVPNNTESNSTEALVTLQKSLDDANAEIGTLNTRIQELLSTQASEKTSDDPDEAFAGLQAHIRQLEDTAEDLRTKLQIFELEKAIPEDGSVSVADQIASQIEPIRQELIRRHEERVKAEEERFKTRVDKMKAALNKQMVKVKEETRASLSSVGQETLDNMTKAHAEEIEALNRRHGTELDELRRHTKDDNAEQTTTASFEPTEEQIREMLKHNAYARKLVKNSIDNQVKKSQEESQTRLEETMKKSQDEHSQNLQTKINQIRTEEQKKLEEQLQGVEERIVKAKEDAETLTKKKYDVKISMTENRLSMATAKITYVQNAAKETPDEAVSKVWDAAKDVKPAPKSATAPTQPVSAAPAASTASTTASVPAAAPTQNTTQAAAKPQGGLSSSTFGQPGGQSGIRKPSGTFSQSGPPAGMAALGLTAPAPQIGANMQQSQHARGGRGGTGIPRGGGIPRGRGSGIPRGGRGGGSAQTVSTNNAPAANAPGSPSTPLNPSAAQFVPGQKRGLDEGTTSEEKRTKTE